MKQIKEPKPRSLKKKKKILSVFDEKPWIKEEWENEKIRKWEKQRSSHLRTPLAVGTDQNDGDLKSNGGFLVDNNLWNGIYRKSSVWQRRANVLSHCPF